MPGLLAEALSNMAATLFAGGNTTTSFGKTNASAATGNSVQTDAMDLYFRRQNVPMATRVSFLQAMNQPENHTSEMETDSGNKFLFPQAPAAHAHGSTSHPTVF